MSDACTVCCHILETIGYLCLSFGLGVLGSYSVRDAFLFDWIVLKASNLLKTCHYGCIFFKCFIGIPYDTKVVHN